MLLSDESLVVARRRGRRRGPTWNGESTTVMR
jgi:hypothetical protein